MGKLLVVIFADTARNTNMLWLLHPDTRIGSQTKFSIP